MGEEEPNGSFMDTWLDFTFMTYVVDVILTSECIQLYFLCIVPPMFILGCVCNVIESCHAPMFRSVFSIM